MKRLLTLAFVGLLSLGCGGSDQPAEPASTPAATGGEDGSGAKPEGGSGTTEVNFNIDGLPTLAVMVPGIHCEACAAGVSDTLAQVDGVQDVTVDVATKTATVAIDESAFKTDTAIQALADAEFENSTVVEDASEEAESAAAG